MQFYSSIRALNNAYQSGETTPLRYVTGLLERAKQMEKGVFITLLETRALQEATASTARWNAGNPLGLFDGVPTVWKDLFDIEDTVTTGASLAYANAPVKTKDAPAVAFYSAQGGINLGKVGLSELAYSGLGINPEMGTPSNPRDAENTRIPGGSSSGTAVAVARDIVSFGMGTDTSGSIRIPASMQGLYGYKPQGDFFPDTAGIMPLSTTLDVFGPIAGSLQDCFDLFSLFQGREQILLQEMPAETSPYRYIVPSNLSRMSIDTDVLENFEAVIVMLQNAGIQVEYSEMPAIDAVADITQKYGTFAAVEATYYHQNVLADERRNLINPRVSSRMARVETMSALDFYTLQTLRESWVQAVKAQYANACILMPTVPMEAPLQAPLEADDALFNQENLRAMSLTVIANFLAWDSITIPMGLGDENMPLGLMLSSVDGDAGKLFSASNFIDRLLTGNQR